jgi:hypothetical protein
LNRGRRLLLPIGQGVIATLLAAFIVASWFAVGSAFIRSIGDDDPIVAPLSLLIGSGLTSLVLALFAAGGHVAAGVVLCALLCTIALG